MRLDLTWRGNGRPADVGRRPPLRTVTEIAEMLGVPRTTLVRALHQDPTAPSSVIRGRDAGHYVTGEGKVWYEPRAVMRWWKGRA